MQREPGGFRTVSIVVDGKQSVLSDGPLRIGRAPDAEIRVDRPGISRLHAVVRPAAYGCVFEDAESHNGCYSDGRRIDRLEVEDRATIRLADPTVGVVVEILVGEPATPEPHLELGGATETHSTRSNRTSIGRSPDNDIIIDDLMVSRHHAIVERSASGELVLMDLGSHNGTSVNGQRVEKATLETDDVVAIGSHLFRVIADGLEEHVDTGAIRFDVGGISVEVGDGLVLLDDVTFSLPENSLMAVIGPSGSGKTTLLNALTGFRPADRGQVLYAGMDLYESYDALRQRIGYVPQDDILHTGLRVEQALRYAARLRFPPDVGSEERRGRVNEVMGELGLAHRADVPIGNLSGGQRKRASVGFELLTKPSLLFLDEPTSGLDPGYERSLTRLLRELADGGRTVVVVTHSVQSLDLCDRLLILAPGGRVAFFGRPDQARGFFEVDAFSELYEKLESDPPEMWPTRFEDSNIRSRQRQAQAASQIGRTTVSRRGPAPIKRPGWLRQFATLTRRYLSVLAADRRLLLMMLLQAPLLGALLWAMSRNRYLEKGPDPLDYSVAKVMLTVIVLGVTWLGLSNAIREIVKERDVYARERAVGLSISAYLASKAGVLGLITVIQSAILVLVATGGQGSNWGQALIRPARLELVVGGALAGVAAMALGLFISTLTRSTDRAMTILPLVLVLQLVLSGLIPGDASVVLDYGKNASSAYWGVSAMASTVDLSELEAFNECLAAVGPSGAGGGLADDLATNWLCVRLARETEDGAAVSAAFDRAYPEHAGKIDALVAASGDQAQLKQALITELDLPESQAGRVAETVLGEPPLRYWDQTPTHWLINVAVLSGMIVFWLVAAGLALRLQDSRMSE